MNRFSWKTLLWLAATVGIATFVEGQEFRGEGAKPQAAFATPPLPLSPSPTLASPAPVLLVFHAEWCGPCRAMKPVVDQLAADGYDVARVNIDGNRELAAHYRVDRIPCFIVIERGKEVDRIVGVATVERLKVKMKGEIVGSRQRAVGSGQLVVGGRQRAADSAKPQAVPVSPPLVSAGPRPQSPAPRSERRPSPDAWRYEKPVGHRAAVVRIYCQDNARTRSVGSGVLVRWGGRVVALTARHVVRDAKTILIELHTKRTHWGRVLQADAAWDCAVLAVVGNPEGVEPAEVELGAAAVQHPGDVLESCGYGPDGRLACNTGAFRGYRRSSAHPAGPPDDWIELSGPARPGDSGGPIFNARSRVVGVLWGTNGEIVVGVQAGRVHRVLTEAVEGKRGRGGERETRRPANSTVPISQSPSLPLSHSSFSAVGYELGRHPTPPMTRQPAMPLEDPPRTAGDCPNCQSTAKEEVRSTPILPWRGQTQERDDAQDARIRALLELQERQAREPVAAGKADVAAEAAKPEAAGKRAPSPLVAGLCIAAAVALGFVLYFSMPKD
jgi:thiol-disulfide isomerase/thioredoxin